MWVGSGEWVVGSGGEQMGILSILDRAKFDFRIRIRKLIQYALFINLLNHTLASIVEHYQITKSPNHHDLQTPIPPDLFPRSLHAFKV